MDVFKEYLEEIENEDNKKRVTEVLDWVSKTFPNLEKRFAWNQPMFTDHGTFIIGFSYAKKHMAFAPERAGILHFSEEVIKSGYEHTNQLVRIKWTDDVDYNLLERVIKFNILEKAECTTFWRK